MFEISKFLKHFLISGLLVGTFAYFSDETKNKLCVFLYCGLPVGFLYMFLSTKMNHDSQINYTISGIIGCLFFILYMTVFYIFLRNKINIYLNIFLSLIIFLIILIIVNKYMYKIF